MDVMNDDPYAPPVQSLKRYRNSCYFLKDEHFLKQLEGDAVDTDILDEEIHNVNDSKPKTCRGKTLEILNSNPFQITLFVLVLLDAVIVITEILLDLHFMRSQLADSHNSIPHLNHPISDMNGFDPSKDFDSLVQVLNLLVTHYEEDFHNHRVDNNSSGLQDTSNKTSPSHPCDSYCYKISAADKDDKHSRKKRRLQNQGVFKIVPFLPKIDTQNSKLLNVIHDEASRFKRGIKKDKEYDGTDEDTSHLNHEAGSHSDDDDGNNHMHDETKSHSDYREATEGHESGDHGHSNSHKIAHILHLCSVAILSLFMLQLVIRVFAMGKQFFNEKFEIFDAIVIILSFILDLVFIDGITSSQEEAVALLIILLLWRLIRVINGLLVTEKKRQEFRLKLQVRSRVKTEQKLKFLSAELELKDKEIEAMRGLCREHDISDEEVDTCKPEDPQLRSTLPVALTSIAAFSNNHKRKKKKSKSYSGLLNLPNILFGSKEKLSKPGRISFKPRLTSSSRHIKFEDDYTYIPAITKKSSFMVPRNESFTKVADSDDSINEGNKDEETDESLSTENLDNLENEASETKMKQKPKNPSEPNGNVPNKKPSSNWKPENKNSNHPIPVIITTNADEDIDIAGTSVSPQSVESEPLILSNSKKPVNSQIPINRTSSQKSLASSLISSSSSTSLSNLLGNSEDEWSHVALTID